MVLHIKKSKSAVLLVAEKMFSVFVGSVDYHATFVRKVCKIMSQYEEVNSRCQRKPVCSHCKKIHAGKLRLHTVQQE